MIQVQLLNGGTPDHVGIIPQFLGINDPRPAATIFNEAYSFGGGWNPMNKWSYEDVGHSIKYPGDPIYVPRAFIRHNNERIYIYDSAWVCIVQPDGSFEVSRMD